MNAFRDMIQIFLNFRCVGFRPVSSMPSEDEEVEEEDMYHNPLLEDITASPQTAAEAYRSSILALGSSTHRAMARVAVTAPTSSSQAQRPAHRPALIDEREMVGDDWLIDDLQPSSRKRRDHGTLGGILSSDSVRPAREHKRARLSTKHRHPGRDAGDGDAFRTSEAEGAPHENLSGRDAVSPLCSAVDGVDRVACSRSESGGEEDKPLPVLSHGVRGAETSERLTGSACSVQATASSFVRGEELRRLTDCRAGPAPERLSCGERSRLCDPPFLASAPARLARVKVKIEGSVFLIPLPAG